MALWAVVSCAAAGGIKLEKTPAGNALSGAVCSMLLTAVACNVGILPAVGSAHLSALQGFVVQLATPLLLFGANLRRILKETDILLKAFAVAAVGTALGATAAVCIAGASLAGLEAVAGVWPVLAALTAKNIGGGLNYVAVAGALGVKPALFSTGLA
ncbi:unnamed protein product, partial [Phaeothamnion confervicola]